MSKIYVSFVCLFFLVLIGCGDLSGSNPTTLISSIKAEPTEVAPGGSAIITVSVVKTGGESALSAAGEADPVAPTAAWGVNVTYRLLTSNGGRLSSSSQRTDGSGTASVVYTAGNNYSQDVIQATLENGNSAFLIVKKTGTAPGISIKITAPPSSPSVKANGFVSITAQVTDNSGNPVSGEAIEFSLLENGSGATVKVQNAVTDAAGNATALYQAGGNHPANDVVQAKLLSNGSVSTIIITVTGGAPGPIISSLATVPANATIKSGQQCIITVTVKDGSTTPSPVSGALVYFQINPNSSGSSLIIPNSYTDSQGQVVVTFIGGVRSPVTVTDTVTAQVASSGSSGSVVITVNP